MPIVEATSGNTGISLAAIGALLNHEVHIFMPDWASQERINIMKLYGANVHLVSKKWRGFHPLTLRCAAFGYNELRPRQSADVSAHCPLSNKNMHV